MNNGIVRRPVIAAVVAALAGCGGSPNLDVSTAGEYEFGSTLSCLKAVRSLRTYAAPHLGGEPIRSIAIYDGDEELVTVYVAPSAAVAREVDGTMVDDIDVDVYGNVAVVWTKASDDAVRALNRCLR